MARSEQREMIAPEFPDADEPHGSLPGAGGFISIAISNSMCFICRENKRGRKMLSSDSIRFRRHGHEDGSGVSTALVKFLVTSVTSMHVNKGGECVTRFIGKSR